MLVESAFKGKHGVFGTDVGATEACYCKVRGDGVADCDGLLRYVQRVNGLLKCSDHHGSELVKDSRSCRAEGSI